VSREHGVSNSPELACGSAYCSIKRIATSADPWHKTSAFISRLMSCPTFLPHPVIDKVTVGDLSWRHVRAANAPLVTLLNKEKNASVLIQMPWLSGTASGMHRGSTVWVLKVDGGFPQFTGLIRSCVPPPFAILLQDSVLVGIFARTLYYGWRFSRFSSHISGQVI